MAASPVRPALLAGLSLLAAVAAGSDDVVLRCRLSECIQKAYASHPLLAASDARRTAARALVGEREAERRPTAEIVGGTGYINGEAVTPFGAFGGRRDPSQPLTISGFLYDFQIVARMPVFSEGQPLGGASPSQREAALRAAQEDVGRDGVRRRLASEVAQSYYAALQLSEATRLHEAISNARQSQARQAKAQFEQRLISRDDAVLAEVQLGSAQRDLAIARLSLENAQRLLARTIGLLDGRAEALPEILEGIVPDDAVAAHPETWPDVKAGTLGLEAKDMEILRISKARLPSADLTARYGVADAFQLPLNNQFYFGLRVTIPVFDSGLGSRQRARAVAERDEAKANIDNLKLTLTAQIESLLGQRRVLEADEKALDAQIRQASEVLETKRALVAQELSPPAAAAEAEIALRRLELARSSSTLQKALVETQLRIAAGQWDSAPRPAGTR